MRISRISQETAKAIDYMSSSQHITRRQTRSSAASLGPLAADSSMNNLASHVKSESVKEEDSDLSSAHSLDIEDIGQLSTRSRKRKRDIATPATILSSVSSTITPRESPSRFGLKIEKSKDRRVKQARRQPARKSFNEGGKVTIHPPANWEQIYDAVKEMRRKTVAPVDTMGCETLAEEHLTPRDKRFQTLIALMLSSQTKDTTNAIAMRRLQTDLPSPGLTLENILEVDPILLNEMIYVVGFHNNKTRYIKATATILREKWSSDIPDTIEGLMSLPGVGPKMAYLCLSAAWGRTEGIGVDVHVHRITNLWGWHKTKVPEETREALEAWLPKEKWHEINHLLVGFGQTVCLPVGRKCQGCTLSREGLCPSAVVERRTTLNRVKTEKIGEDGGQKHGTRSEQMVTKEEITTAESLT